MDDSKIIGQVQFRVLEVAPELADREQRTIPVALSSETEVRQWFGREKLLHTPEAIDLSGVGQKGLPLLVGHQIQGPESNPIGRVKSIGLDADGVLRGIAHFGASTRAREAFTDVMDGISPDVSIGYEISKFDRDKYENEGLLVAQRWRPVELSVVGVPADHTVGFNRARHKEDAIMTDSTDTTAQAGQAGGDSRPVVVQFEEARQLGLREGREAARRELLQRVAQINTLFSAPRYQTDTYRGLRDELISRGVTLDEARDALLAQVGATTEPMAPPAQADRSASLPRASMGETESEKALEGAELALLVRAGIERDKDRVREARENEFLTMPLLEIARDFLRRANVSTRGMDRMALAGAAFMTRSFIGHTTSDLANLLANVAEKSMLRGWDSRPNTWSGWTKPGTLSDFKQATRAGLSEFPQLLEVPEGAEIKLGTMGDRKELISLVTYARRVALTRQTIINDDLQALTELPMKAGRAAAAIPADLAYAVLTSNPTLNQDSTQLFHADHGNYVTSGAAPSVATLQAGRVAMGLQMNQNGTEYLQIIPAHIVCPLALEDTCNVLMTAQYDPAGTAGTLTPNTSPRMQVHADPRLDAFNAAGWFLAADGAAGYDTVEVAFLDGQQTPFIETMNGWSIDGTELKVRLDVGAAALDFRGLYYNDGA